MYWSQSEGWDLLSILIFTAGFIAFLQTLWLLIKPVQWSLYLNDNSITWTSPFWPKEQEEITIENISIIQVREGYMRKSLKIISKEDGKVYTVPDNCYKNIEELLVNMKNLGLNQED